MTTPLDPTAANVPVMESKQWSPLDLIVAAWDRFKQDWLALLGAVFATVVINYVLNQIIIMVWGPTQIKMEVHSLPEAFAAVPWRRVGLSGVALYVLTSFAQAGRLAVFIRSARGQQPDFMAFFAGMRRFLQWMLANLLVGLITAIGFVFFIVPGIILLLGLCLAPLYAVDRGYGPFQALSASWQATSGHKWRIFLLFLCLLGICFLGLLACIVGLIVAIPLSSLSVAMLYVALSDAMAKARAQ